MTTSREPEVAAPQEHKPAGPRRQARERALALLYEAESRSVDPAEVVAELPLAPDQYAADLVAGVCRHAAEIDAAISAHATGWTLDRMPSLDRNILRIATFELLHVPDVPTAVAIDEAVELAKTYSTEDSGRYVNGVLSSVASVARPVQ